MAARASNNEGCRVAQIIIIHMLIGYGRVGSVEFL